MGKIRAVAYHRIDYATIAQRVGQYGDRRKASTKGGPMTSVCAPSTSLSTPSHSTHSRHICATAKSKRGRATLTTSDRSELLPLCLPSPIITLFSTPIVPFSTPIIPFSTLSSAPITPFPIPPSPTYSNEIHSSCAQQSHPTQIRPNPARLCILLLSPPTAHHSCNALRCCCCPRRSRRRPRSGVGCCCSCFVFGTDDDESPRILYAYLNYARKEAPASAPTPTPP